MANPRQRRKQRSGTAKVKHSKASVKNKHKVIIKGPEVLVTNYDRKKTVRQNYAKLGLLATLNPRQAGGIVPVEPTPFAVSSAIPSNISDLDSDEDAESEDEDEPEAPVPSTSTVPAERKLGKGEGRIIRDPETGKILRIVMGGEDGEEISEDIVAPVRGEEDSDSDDESDDEDDVPTTVQKPWGEAMDVWSGEESGDEVELEEDFGLVGPRSVGQGIPIGAKRRKVVAKTDVVRQLEALAATQRTVIRHTSTLEGDWLMSMIEKYGDDVDKMARDRKVNVWQKTAGEIKRAVTKAGGFSKLKVKLQRQAAEAAAEAAAESTSMEV